MPQLLYLYSCCFEVTLILLQYSWLGSVLYFGILAMQPITALILVKFPTGKVISIAIFMWGVSLCCMAAAKNFHALLGLRLLLGAFESFIGKGASICEIDKANKNRSNLGGGYADVVSKIRTDKQNSSVERDEWSHCRRWKSEYLWAWPHWDEIFAFISGKLSLLLFFGKQLLTTLKIIFLFCGGITLVFAVVSFFFFPDSPMEAKFWREGERDIAIERLRANQTGIVSRKWRWEHVWEALLDLKSYFWFFLVLGIS